MVTCLEQGADLHIAQLMPLPLTVSCFSKIQIGFTFLVPTHLGSHGKRAIKRVCVCVCVNINFEVRKFEVHLTSLKWTRLVFNWHSDIIILESRQVSDCCVFRRFRSRKRERRSTTRPVCRMTPHFPAATSRRQLPVASRVNWRSMVAARERRRTLARSSTRLQLVTKTATPTTQRAGAAIASVPSAASPAQSRRRRHRPAKPRSVTFLTLWVRILRLRHCARHKLQPVVIVLACVCLSVG